MKENYERLSANKLEVFNRQKQQLDILYSANKITKDEHFQQTGEILKKASRLVEMDEEIRRTNRYADGFSSFLKWALWGASGIFTLYSNLRTISSGGLSSVKWGNGLGNLLGLVVLLWPIISGIYIVSDVRHYLRIKEKREKILYELKNL